jgi:hypothetical protein
MDHGKLIDGGDYAGGWRVQMHTNVTGRGRDEFVFYDRLPYFNARFRNQTDVLLEWQY